MSNLAEPIAEELVQRLNANSEFEVCAKWFDGSILLESGEDQCWLKLYKGKVLDRLSIVPPLGYTFKLSASDESWRMAASGEKSFWELFTPGVRDHHLVDDPDFKTVRRTPIRLEGNLMEANRLYEAVVLLAESYLTVLRDLTIG